MIFIQINYHETLTWTNKEKIKLKREFMINFIKNQLKILKTNSQDLMKTQNIEQIATQI